MKFSFKKNFSLKIFIFFAFCGSAIIFQGCVPPENANGNSNGNKTQANAQPATTNTNSVKTENKESASRMPVTLPVLDAMFSDETFAQDLKVKLQLTDEQINKLKTVSGEDRSKLNEEESDSSGSTRAASERASKQIREILGEEKSGEFFNFVRERWQGGADDNESETASGKINVVPGDTRIVVNAPAYRMDLFQDGKLVKTYKIGIGYPEFPLPKGMRRADTIIFNPTWTPPDEPWVKGKLEPGKTVEAGSKDNPLGPIKIPIGLPSLIHGGKQPARLGTFASHGCVGLTSPLVQDFAFELAKLSGTQLSLEDIKGYEKQKTETKNFKLSKAIPVELRYETIVVEDGKLKIYRDVYEHGTNTEENLRKVLESYGVSFDSLKEQDRQNILKGLQQMAVDATGKPVDEDGSNANANNANSGSKNKNSNVNTNADNGSVTRNVKGKKEVSFDIPELKGKGYPAAVNMKM